MKTIVYPQTAFGVFIALAGRPLVSCTSPSLSAVLSRLPNVLLWNWLNLLIFNLSNQRLPQSVLEDSINKPGRNIPTGRVTASQTTHLLCAMLIIVFITTKYWLGAHYESLVLMMFTWIYNDLGGAEEAYLIRNALNALGYIFYAAGSTRIAAHEEKALTGTAWLWILFMGLVVASTVQVQDLQDQEGDRLRNRKTVPLMFGDAWARYTLVPGIFMWSLLCPAFWQLGPGAYVAPIVVGTVIIVSMLDHRNPGADKRLFKIWCLWLVVLYLLPLLRHPESVLDYKRLPNC